MNKFKYLLYFVISIFTIEDNFVDADEVEKEVVGSEFYHFNSDLLHWLFTEGSSNEAEVVTEGSSHDAEVVADEFSNEAEVVAEGSSNEAEVVAEGSSHEAEVVADECSIEAEVEANDSDNDSDIDDSTDEIDWTTCVVEAARCGNLDFIRWISMRKKKTMKKIMKKNFEKVVYVSASKGQRNMLEWVQAKWDSSFEKTTAAVIADLIPDICIYATRMGYLNTLQWAILFGIQMDLYNCLYAGIQNKKLNVLIWLKQEYFSSNFWCVAVNCKPLSLCAAAEANSVKGRDIFQWVHLNGCPWNEDTYATLIQSRCGNNIIEWALNNGCPETNDIPKRKWKQDDHKINVDRDGYTSVIMRI